MSFELNGPTPINKPMIQESQSMQNNGGGGNLGYFKRGKQKKKKEDNLDTFESSSKSEEEILDEQIDINLNFKSIAGKIKGFFKKSE